MSVPSLRRVFVAYDATRPADAALAAAVRLAKASGARLEIAYAEAPAVAVPYTYDSFDASAARAIAREAARFQREWRAKARAAARALPPGKARLAWLSGWSPDKLLERAHQWGADLIVAGTHGRAGIDRLILGSVAEALVRRARVPVLCVHDGAPAEGGILAPYNLQAYSDPALLLAFDLAAATGRKLTVLRICGKHEPETREELEQAVRLDASFGERALPEIEYRIRRGEPRAAIAAEAATGRYGLVVLSPHVGGLPDRALGGTAERLLRKVRVPVLTVPAEAPRGRGRPGPAGRGRIRTARGTGPRGAGRGAGRRLWRAAER